MEKVAFSDFRCRKNMGQLCYGKRELSLLLEIITVLNDQSFEIKTNLNKVIDKISEHLGARQVILTILNRSNQQIVIEVASGLPQNNPQNITYNLGEGIFGKVVESGKPVVIPRVFENPDFLNKTGVLSLPESS